MVQNVILLEVCYSPYVIGAIIAYPFLIVFSAIRALYRCLKISRKSIEGEVALITGSGRGLGRDIAIALAKLGCHIAIVDVQGKLAEETAAYIAKTYGVKAKSYKVDVTDYQQLLDLRTKVTNDLGDVTILINNAGILTLSSWQNPPPEDIQLMVNVNLIGMIYVTQVFLPKMKQLNRGHCVNISSLSVIMPSPLYAVYGATKAAVRHFTSSLRIELMQCHSNVKATTIFPTFLTTNERTEQLVQQSFGSKVGPTTSGDVVARYLVSAIRRGDDEVTVPHIVIYFPRLISLFSRFFLERFIAVATNTILRNQDLNDLNKFLKPDIERDL